MRNNLPRSHRFAILSVALAALLFVGATLLAPLLEARHHPAGALARAAFFPLCHQLADRSLSVDGHILAVCARCFGLYAGGVLGLLTVAIGLSRPARCPATWLLVALLPTTVDFLLPFVGLPQLSNVPRTILALPGGLVLGLHLGWALVDWIESHSSRRSRFQPSTNITAPVLEDLNE